MQAINKIVVHCSDSPQGRGDNAATIHRWHQERDWSGIGYHYVVLEDGTIEAGRPEYWQGAHVQGHNRESIGICLIGTKKFTSSQFDALYDKLSELCERHPRAVVYGHRDLAPGRDCPGFDVSAWLESRVNQ